MEKFIYNHENDLWYELHGDYYIPCLIATEEEQKPVGIWGRRHHKYIKARRKGLYLDLLFQGKLNSYLVQINEQAEEMLSQLVKQLAEADGITEELKATDQMLWVQRMNAVHQTATELINNELIYV